LNLLRSAAAGVRPDGLEGEILKAANSKQRGSTATSLFRLAQRTLGEREENACAPLGLADARARQEPFLFLVPNATAELQRTFLG
jgi:hypothetical protein